MGVGAAGPGRAAAAAAWLLATAVTAAATAPLPPRVSLALVGGGLLLALVRPPWPLLAILAAPLWLQAGGISGALGADPRPAGLVGAVVLAAALLLLPRPGGRRLRAGLIVLGSVLALRAMLVASELPGGPPLGGALFLGGLLAAGAAALPAARPRAVALVVVAAAGVHVARALPALQAPPTTAGEVARHARLGLVDRHAPALAAQPALGLLALRHAPRAHGVALALLPTVGAQRLVDVGWQPSQAELLPADRIDIARALDRRGRGGEALRLLWRARDQPRVAWWFVLLSRTQGLDSAGDQVLDRIQAPAEVHQLPGRVDLDLAFLRTDIEEVILHTEVAVDGFVLHTRGEAWQGLPRLQLQVDGRPPRQLDVPEGAGVLRIEAPLAVGPHALRLSFLNDAAGADGDRNLWVDAVAAPLPPESPEP